MSERGVARHGEEIGFEPEVKRSLRVWLQLMKCSKEIESFVGAALRGEFQQSLSRFDVLAQLYREDGGWMTVGELGRRVMASRGNISGLIERMENEGLLLRRSAPGDRRSYQIRMSDCGRRLFLDMSRTHAERVDAALADVAAADKEQLIALLVRVRRAFERRRGDAAPAGR